MDEYKRPIAAAREWARKHRKAMKGRARQNLREDLRREVRDVLAKKVPPDETR